MKKAKKPGKKVTIFGILEEIENDDDSIGLVIATDEEDYIVEMDKKGKELLDEIDRDIEATGVVTKDEDGVNHITLSSFELFEPDDEFDDDEFDYQDDEDDRNWELGIEN